MVNRFREKMNYVIEITGGIGKHVMATSFIKWLNEKEPKKKITVVSAYPEIFEYNPRIYRNLHLTQPYLFEDYIKNADYRKGNPYELKEFYREKNKKHLCQIFPKAYGFGVLDENPEEEIFLTKGEEQEGINFNNQYGNKVITFQCIGGLPPNTLSGKEKMDSSQRDMPHKIAIKIIDILNKRGYKVLQLKGKQEPRLPNTLQMDAQFRNLIPIVKYAVAHIGIDSSWMHVAGCFKKPMLTFWGGTHKDSFGYFHEGTFNSFTKYDMHGRPYFAIHDREALYPYKSSYDGLGMNYTDREIEKKVDELLANIDNKVIKVEKVNCNK